MHVNELNAREDERNRAQRTVLECISKLNENAANKAEILANAGHRGVPILFEHAEIKKILWDLAKRMKT